MPSTKDLRSEIAALSTKAQETVLDKDLTQAEKKTALDGIETEAQAKTIQLRALEVDESDTKGIEAQRAAIESADAAPVYNFNAGGKSVGEQFFDAENVKELMAAGKMKSGTQFASGTVEIKTSMSESASPVITPAQPMPGVVDIRFQPATVESLIASSQTTSNAVPYLKETTATNAAAAVAELGTKPESTLVLAEVTEAVKKVATTFKASDEILEDLPAARGLINTRGALFVTLAVDDQILNGSGSGANIEGIRNRSGLASDVALGSDTGPDAIYKQITAIRSTAFIEPDGIVVHPNDWQDIRLAKDDNGQYYAGGPFMGQYGTGGMAGDYLWGKPVIVTTAITEGTALVGAFATCAIIWNRQGLTVESTNTDQDDFIKNRMTFRFERRFALGVLRPGAFGEVTGL